MARLSDSAPTSSFQPLVVFIVSIAGLYFARQILIPLALALLLTFMLAPVVKRLETWHFGRVLAVITVAISVLAVSGVLGWIVANQLVEAVNELPGYTENIHRKMEVVRGPKGGSLAKFAESVQGLSNDLASLAVAREPGNKVKSSTSGKQKEALPVQIVQPPANPIQAFRDLAGPVLSLLSATGIVVVFAIFMLIEHEHLRNRLFGLAGLNQINAMTQALDDAAQRVSRYLLMQVLVNAFFGCVVGAGLYFIGVPHALLWAVLGALLRFLPYIGPLIAGALPLILALAVSEGWKAPILTVVLFGITELVVGNVVEPWLYGAHTGISALAILVAAVFWTVVWGTVGLVLSTPLTVCLIVLGRHVPQLEFLNVLLGDDPGLPAEAHYYQRLLAMDQREAHAVLESLLKTRPVSEIYDHVILPALSMAEQDRHTGALSEPREQFIVNSINESVLQLAPAQPQAESSNAEDVVGSESNGIRKEYHDYRVLCIPAKDAADEITGAMLAQLLEHAGFLALSFPVTDSPADLLRGISTSPEDIIVVSSLPPFALLHAQRLNKQLRAQFPDSKILVGLWTYPTESAGAEQRVNKAFGTVVTTLQQAVDELIAAAESDSQIRETASEK